MKKMMCVFLAFLSVTLCSCGVSENEAFIPQGDFQADMLYKSEELEFSAQISCRSYSDIEMILISPETLSGMTISVTENGIKSAIEGIEYSFDEDKLTDRPGIALTVFALRKFLYTGCIYSKSENGYSARADCSYGDLTAVCSEDGFLEKIRSQNTEIIFTNVKITEA